MAKELYKITIIDEDKEHTTLYATNVTQADFLGFIEIINFFFCCSLFVFNTLYKIF